LASLEFGAIEFGVIEFDAIVIGLTCEGRPSVLRSTASRSGKPKRSNAKSRARTKNIGFKTSSWYQTAARAIGISHARQSAKVSLS